MSDRTPVRFTIGGRKVELSKAQVERALKAEKPEPINTHAVLVGGVAFPVKQALRATTGFDILDFHTMEARRVFRRLGFELMRKE